jgi:hypothetical protein
VTILKFLGMLQNLWWQSYQFVGDLSYVLACKLKALKGDLRRWNNEVFGHVGKRKKALLEEIRELNSLLEDRGLDEEEKRKKMLLSIELERTLLCEEISWRQESRAIWLKDGNKNTKFFHRVANSNRRVNSIESLMVNGSLSSNPIVIKEHMINFYFKFSLRAVAGGLFRRLHSVGEPTLLGY